MLRLKSRTAVLGLALAGLVSVPLISAPAANAFPYAIACVSNNPAGVTHSLIHDGGSTYYQVNSHADLSCAKPASDAYDIQVYGDYQLMNSAGRAMASSRSGTYSASMGATTHARTVRSYGSLFLQPSTKCVHNAYYSIESEALFRFRVHGSSTWTGWKTQPDAQDGISGRFKVC